MSHELDIRLARETGTSLASQIHETIAWLIVSGQLDRGEKLPNVRDLAKQLGVNLHTVRAAYHQLQAKGLVVSTRGRGTLVQAFDRAGLVTEASHVRTNAIGILIPGYSQFYKPYLRGLEEAAVEEPSLLFICDTHEHTRHVSRYFDQLLTKQVDGIVLTSASYSKLASEVAGIRSLGSPPIVTADCPGIPGPGADFDLEHAAAQATRHLIGHGYRRVGLLTPPLELNVIEPIHRGYLKSMAEHGRPAKPEWVYIGKDFTQASGHELARRVLDDATRPNAFLCAADMLAFGAMRLWKEAGLALPDDIALASIGEIEFAPLAEPPLTTVRLPAHEMGQVAMEILSKLISGHQPSPERVILKGELIVRRSCGCT